MQAWIGKSILIIGVVHSVFGFVVFRSVLAEIAREGFVNTVNGQPMREAAFWFLFFGFMGIILGMFVDWSERKGMELPKFFSWSLLAFTLVFVTIMPISGGWLLFIPTIGALLRLRPSTIFQSESLDGK
jgi:hypothetical protein